MEDVEVVADELVNDALHKRFKMILTREIFIISADADGEVVTEHCEYVWIKLLGGEDENNVQFFK